MPFVRWFMRANGTGMILDAFAYKRIVLVESYVQLHESDCHGSQLAISITGYLAVCSVRTESHSSNNLALGVDLRQCSGLAMLRYLGQAPLGEMDTCFSAPWQRS
jgi:hypothetical protein